MMCVTGEDGAWRVLHAQTCFYELLWAEWKERFVPPGKGFTEEMKSGLCRTPGSSSEGGAAAAGAKPWRGEGGLGRGEHE